MVFNLTMLAWITLVTPLICGSIAGSHAKRLGRVNTHRLTIAGIALSLLASVAMSWQFYQLTVHHVDIPMFAWLDSMPFNIHFGILIDPLMLTMCLVVTFISLLVHIYSIGYMDDDAGYQRFFCYMSLFTFMMLLLVMGDNLIQLFFGWEGVGLISYLLIGFWFHKDSAAEGSFKAFIVNRVGDFGLLLGIGLIFAKIGHFDYATLFANKQTLLGHTFYQYPYIECVCCLLFIGAMGKSAQIPLHVWLPESMEGPTPISALIHAATMVTAGVYMVCRLSPLFEAAPTTRAFMLIIASTGALILGLVGVVQNDIKRVVAYSTLSQLGYMIAATAVSAYSAAMFHLVTHACFKALLFLAAGSVIIGLHHEQDLRKMGGLWRVMPITACTFLIGSLALMAVPGFSGFYSKDAIIAATRFSTLPGASYATWCLTLGAGVTAIYSVRAFSLAFLGQARFTGKAHEPGRSMTMPLVILAIPSLVLGAILAHKMLSPNGLFGHSIYLSKASARMMLSLDHEAHQNLWQLFLSSTEHLPFWCMIIAGTLTGLIYTYRPHLPTQLSQWLYYPYCILTHKFGFDVFNDYVLVRPICTLSQKCYSWVDQMIIDRFIVHGFAKAALVSARIIRPIQTGYLYHYMSIMLIGVIALMVIVLGYFNLIDFTHLGIVTHG